MKTRDSKDLFTNDEIISEAGIPESSQVRVVGADGEQLGMLTLGSAIDLAFDKDLDLVLMAAQATPPVCRIMDYGKFCFERDKKDKEAKKKQQRIEIKEIQLSCRIDVNDFNTKINNAKRFLSEGNKVKVIVRFKGRQMTHIDIGADLLNKFCAALTDTGEIDKKPVLEGRNMTLFLVPVTNSNK